MTKNLKKVLILKAKILTKTRACFKAITESWCPKLVSESSAVNEMLILWSPVN